MKNRLSTCILTLTLLAFTQTSAMAADSRLPQPIKKIIHKHKRDPKTPIPVIEPTVMLGAFYKDETGGNISILEDQIGRTLALQYTYATFLWTSKIDNAIKDNIAKGRTTVLAWSATKKEGDCATAKDVIAGKYDEQVKIQAAQLRDYKVPIMVDYIPEMTNEVGEYGPLQCYYGVDWYDTPEQKIKSGADYIAAQHHLVQIFRDVGATNVQMVFAPAGRAFRNTLGDKLEWVHFYPGDTYVDWIGMDYFQGLRTAVAFDQNETINAFYNAAQPTGKRLMIAQTTAYADPSMDPDPQTLWVRSAMETIPTKYPAIHAFIYNNDYIRNSSGESNGALNLDLEGKGLEAFKVMGEDPHFIATDSLKFF